MRPKPMAFLNPLCSKRCASLSSLYEETFGFRVISDFGDRGCAMHAGTHQVLLLFKKGASRAIQSPHDGGGELPSRSGSHAPSWPIRGCVAETRRVIRRPRREAIGFAREAPFLNSSQHLVCTCVHCATTVAEVAG